MKVLITGGSGFVGRYLQGYFNSDEYDVAITSRCKSNISDFPVYTIPAIDQHTDWKHALKNVDVVVHLASRAHSSDNHSEAAKEDFTKTNVLGLSKLLDDCIFLGVKRIIYLSSIKALGESTDGRDAFSESDKYNPADYYGITKARAEQLVVEKCKHSGLDYTIIRPPLVYGKSAKANLQSIARGLSYSLPFPYFTSSNRRSLISVHSLCRFIVAVANDPNTNNQIYNVADNYVLSTKDIFSLIKSCSNSKSFIFPIPKFIFTFLAFFWSKFGDVSTKLYGSLEINNTKATKVISWKPLEKPEKNDFV